MSDIFTLFLHVIVTVIRLAKPGGLRSVVAESTLIRQQLLIVNRGRKRAPNLRVSDRIVAGLCTLLMRPARVLRSAIVLRSSTLLGMDLAMLCPATPATCRRCLIVLRCITKKCPGGLSPGHSKFYPAGAVEAVIPFP